MINRIHSAIIRCITISLVIHTAAASFAAEKKTPAYVVHQNTQVLSSMEYDREIITNLNIGVKVQLIDISNVNNRYNNGFYTFYHAEIPGGTRGWIKKQNLRDKMMTEEEMLKIITSKKRGKDHWLALNILGHTRSEKAKEFMLKQVTTGRNEMVLVTYLPPLGHYRDPALYPLFMYYLTNQGQITENFNLGGRVRAIEDAIKAYDNEEYLKEFQKGYDIGYKKRLHHFKGLDSTERTQKRLKEESGILDLTAIVNDLHNAFSSDNRYLILKNIHPSLGIVFHRNKSREVPILSPVEHFSFTKMTKLYNSASYSETNMFFPFNLKTADKLRIKSCSSKKQLRIYKYDDLFSGRGYHHNSRLYKKSDIRHDDVVTIEFGLDDESYINQVVITIVRIKEKYYITGLKYYY